jgi:integrase
MSLVYNDDMALTDKEIKAAINLAKKTSKDVWLSDSTGQRVGWVLQIRAFSNGNARWYFRYNDVGGKRRNHSIGTYPDLGLANARIESAKLAVIYKDDRNLKAVLFEQEQAKEEIRRQQQEERDELERQKQDASKITVGALMDLYVQDLILRGKKSSAGDAKSVFKVHASSLRSLPAHAITRQHITDCLRKLVESDKGRSASVLRSYLAAAFKCALDAEDDASIHSDFLVFRRAGLERNPVIETKALTKFIKPRERHLNETEFRFFWGRLADAGIKGMILQTTIALGGQRIAQLLRAEIKDISDDILTLRDTKGRRVEARLHYLPLVGLAKSLVEASKNRSSELKTEWLFSLDGKKAVHPDTLSHLVTDISQNMLDQGEVDMPFQMRDIRRTIETTLSKMGVSESHRAQIQSHGLSGVQARHYDKHNYLEEKKLALLMLSEWIVGSSE